MLSPTSTAEAAAAGLLGVEVVVVPMPVALVVVGVAVELGLLEQEEEQQPRQQGGEQRARMTRASKASGSTFSKAVASSTPVDRLTRCLTSLPSTAKVIDAAMATDSTPPTRVAVTM
jgi:hypothetical protein